MQFRGAPFQSESLARLVRKLRSVHEQQKRFTHTKNQNVIRNLRSLWAAPHAIVNLTTACALRVLRRAARLVVCPKCGNPAPSQIARRAQPVGNRDNERYIPLRQRNAIGLFVRNAVLGSARRNAPNNNGGNLPEVPPRCLKPHNKPSSWGFSSNRGLWPCLKVNGITRPLQ
jgi:hypothetical protein